MRMVCLTGLSATHLRNSLVHDRLIPHPRMYICLVGCDLWDKECMWEHENECWYRKYTMDVRDEEMKET